MSIYNLTGANVVIYHDDSETVKKVISPWGAEPEFDTTETTQEPLMVDGIEIPVVDKQFDSLAPGIPPEPVEGLDFIVPVSVALAAKLVGRGTSDLYYPDEPVVRKEGGRIYGYRRLARVSPFISGPELQFLRAEALKLRRQANQLVEQGCTHGIEDVTYEGLFELDRDGQDVPETLRELLEYIVDAQKLLDAALQQQLRHVGNNPQRHWEREHR